MDLAGTGGVEPGFTKLWGCITTTGLNIMKVESMSRAIGHINLWEKLTGKRSAGNPHAAFDEAGTGDGHKPTRQPSTLPVRG